MHTSGCSEYIVPLPSGSGTIYPLQPSEHALTYTYSCFCKLQLCHLPEWLWRLHEPIWLIVFIVTGHQKSYSLIYRVLMFNHMCLVITTAIFADFIADFLTPVKTNNYNYEICFAQHIFIRTGETFFVNMLCMHAIADACLNLEGRGGGGGGVSS